jgi:hypothetical protein
MLERKGKLSEMPLNRLSPQLMFDHLLNLAVDGGESIRKQRRTGYSRDPS